MSLNSRIGVPTCSLISDMWIPGFASVSLRRSLLLDQRSIIDQPATAVTRQAYNTKTTADMIIIDFFMSNY